LVYFAEYQTGGLSSVEAKGDSHLVFRSRDAQDHIDIHGSLAPSGKISITGTGKYDGTFEVKSEWQHKNDLIEVVVTDPDMLKDLPKEPLALDPKSAKWSKDSPFTSVPAASWWCVVTLTTVGYGDMYPVTVPGRAIAAVTMFLGLALFGMLMNIVGKAMMAALFGSESIDSDPHPPAPGAATHLPAQWNAGWRHCPTCGKEHSEPHSSSKA
jgi:hypothetical protein